MKLAFDKIYCLHLVDDKRRYNNCLHEFKRIGIWDQVEFWWTCKRNISNIIGEKIPSLLDPCYAHTLKHLNISKSKLMGNVFNCAFEHYSIVKTSYQRGFEHILIMEDDIQFVDNLELIKDTFTNYPKEYDILKFYDVEARDYHDWYSNNPINNKQSFRRYNNFQHSAVCYALSKRGMIAYFTELDRWFTPSDCLNLRCSPIVDDLKIYGLKYRIILDQLDIKTSRITEVES